MDRGSSGLFGAVGGGVNHRAVVWVLFDVEGGGEGDTLVL